MQVEYLATRRLDDRGETSEPFEQARDRSWRGTMGAGFALLLLFVAMHFHVMALDFTTMSPPSISYSVFGPPDQPPVRSDGKLRPLFGMYTADPVGTAAFPPFEAFTFASVKKLQIPFWNPLTLTGYPFLAEFYWSVLYPPKLLMAALPESHRDLYSALHILLTGMFVAWLCWMLTRHWTAAVFAGATVFATGIFLLYFPTHSLIAVAPWGALLLISIELLCQRPSSRIGAVTGVLAVAGLGTAGHPSVAIFLSLGGLLFLLLRLVASQRKWRALSSFLMVGAIGFLLVLPNVFSFAYSFLSGEVSANSFIRPNYYSALQFLQFLLPYAPGPVNEVAASLKAQYGHPVPGFAWGPPLVLFVAAVGLYKAWRLRMTAVLALAGSGALLTLLGLGLIPIDLVTDSVFYNRLNMNYVWIYPAIVICALAGVGLKSLASDDPREVACKVLIPFIFIMVSTAAVYFWYLTNGTPWSLSIESREALLRSLLPGILWGVTAPAVILAATFLNARRSPANQTAVVASLLFLGLGLSAVGYYPSANPKGQMVLPTATVALFCMVAPILASIVSRARGVRGQLSIFTTILMIVAGSSTLASIRYPGLPHRYQVNTVPQFIDLLKAAGPNWRSYGLYGAISTNNLARYGLPVINNLNVVLPVRLREFMYYVDPQQDAHQFYGLARAIGSPADSLISNRRFWNYLSVRFILAPQHALAAAPPDAARFGVPKFEGQPILVPVTASSGPPLRVDLSCLDGSFSTIQVLLSTYGRQNAGRIRAVLRNGEKTVAETFVDAASLRDNYFQDFAFPYQACSHGEATISLQLEHLQAAPGQNVAAWQTSDRPIVAHPVIKSRLNAIGLRALNTDPKTGMMVFENPAAQPRAYLAERVEITNDWQTAMAQFVAQPDLRSVAFAEPSAPVCRDSSPGASEKDSVTVAEVEPNEVHIKANVHRGGALVLVDTYAEGWSAEVNGSTAKVFPVNGVFRAVCLPGPGRYSVIMRYQPPYWNWVVWAPVAGALLLFAVMGRAFRYRRSIQ